VDRKPLDMEDDIIKLTKFGVAYPLFFDFLKNCIIFLCIIFTISNSFQTFINYSGNNCNNDKLNTNDIKCSASLMY